MSKFLLKNLVVISLFGILFFSFSKITLAQANGGSYNFADSSGLELSANKAGYNTSEMDIRTYVSKIISLVLSIIGVIFLVFIIYAGINWMTAAGNDEKVKRSKEVLFESIIGFAIVIGAYAISYFILEIGQNFLKK